MSWRNAAGYRTGEEAKGIGPIAVTCSDNNIPTLSELGIIKRESQEIGV